jgi:hypothetical protein
VKQRWKNIIIFIFIFLVESVAMGTWMFDRAAAEDPQQGHQLVVWSCNTICIKKYKRQIKPIDR